MSRFCFPQDIGSQQRRNGVTLTATLETKAIPPIVLTVPSLITGVDGNGGREWGIPNGRGIQNVAREEICVCVFEI